MLVSFASKIAASKVNSIHELLAKDGNGRTCYYFIEVPVIKEKAFAKACSEGSFDVKAYGKILATGISDKIPESVRNNILNGNINAENG